MLKIQWKRHNESLSCLRRESEASYSWKYLWQSTQETNWRFGERYLDLCLLKLCSKRHGEIVSFYIITVIGYRERSVILYTLKQHLFLCTLLEDSWEFLVPCQSITSDNSMRNCFKFVTHTWSFNNSFQKVSRIFLPTCLIESFWKFQSHN